MKQRNKLFAYNTPMKIFLRQSTLQANENMKERLIQTNEAPTLPETRQAT